MSSEIALQKFLEDHGNDFLRWSRGAVVIESYFAKQFEALGGDTELLIACFEDNGEIDGASSDYFLRRSPSVKALE